jgi:KAP family P-loop domain
MVKGSGSSKARNLSNNNQSPGQSNWFITERPITDVDADAFSHDTIAGVLATSVHQAVEDFTDGPGAATIGLIGGFGTGKTSVVNLAADRLRTDLDINVVHVSADKHSGNARSRNIVHSIAGALVDEELLKEHEVNEHLQWLRSSVSLAAPAPEEMRLAKLMTDPRGQSLNDIWATLVISGVFFALTLIGALFVDGGVGTVMSSVGSLAFVGAFATVAYKHIVGSLFEIPSKSTNRARADAADDVQQVFANLINKYADSNKNRPLVIFVDDIDRLGTADVLDAMRAIKSLQAVPRGKEPTFVVSCDDEIILAALRDQAQTDDQAEAIDRTAGIASHGRQETARAYLQKFFSLRVPMPPHVSDDMPTFVQKLLAQDHPLRSGDYIGSQGALESTLLVLARGHVESPRHLVHRVNGFLTAYRIAVDREKATSKLRLHPGDATGRPILLARLSVIAADFRWFHRSLLQDEALLGAADRLARHEELSATDEELLETYRVAIREKPEEAGSNGADDGDARTEPEQPGTLLWNPQHENLRTYLVSTFVSVEKSGESIVPLLYLAEPEGGRVLGNARVGALVAAVRNGDAARVTEALEQLPSEHGNVTAEQIRETVSSVTSAELPAALVGAAAALPVLGEHAEAVALGIAERLPKIPANTLSEAAYHDLLGALPDSHHNGALRSFATVEDDTSEPDRNDRALAAAKFLASSPNAAHLPEMIQGQLDRLPDHAGWAESHDWVAVALKLDGAVHANLLGNHLIPSVFRLAVGDGSVEFDATAEGLLKLVENLDPGVRNALGPVLRRITPKSEGAARLLVAAYGLVGNIDHADGALRIGEAIGFDLEDDGAAKAVELLGTSVPVWKDATLKKKDESDEDEATRYCADTIGTDLASLISPAPGLATSGKLSEHAPDFAVTSRVFVKLLEAATTAVEEADDASSASNALLTVVRELLTANVEDEAQLKAAVNRVLEPLALDGDLSPKAESLLSAVEHLGQHDDHHPKLAPEIARWTASLKSNANPYLKHPQVAAFNSLNKVAPAAAGSAVDPVFASLNQWLQTASDQGHLRTLAALPWGDQLEPALTLAASKADDFPSFDDLVPVVRRAHDRDIEIPDDLLNRFVKHVQADPIGQIPHAKTIWSSFSERQKSRILFAGLPGSDTATELINGASATTFRYVAIDAAKQDKISDFLDVASLESRSDEIVEIVSSLVDEHATVNETNFRRLIQHVDQAKVAAILVNRLPEPSGEARTALQLLGHLDSDSIDQVMSEIDEAAAAQLRAWDESVIEDLVKSRDDRPLSASLDAVVDEMLGEDGTARSKALKLKPKTGLFKR